MERTFSRELTREVIGEIRRDVRRLWGITAVKIGLVSVVAVVILVVVLGYALARPSIVGTWVETAQDGATPSSPTTMIFANDGTGTIGSTHVHYSMPDSSHLQLDLGSGFSVTSAVSFSNSHMSLTGGFAGNGHTQDYARQ